MPGTIRLGAVAVVVWLLLVVGDAAAEVRATHVPGATSLPETTEENQAGTNNCGTGSSPKSQCQNAYINSATDFCLWAPSTIGTIGERERDVVSYCTKSGRGTRLIPQGALHSVHFIEAPNYVQVMGQGDMTKLNVAPGDGGGELDPHGADGNGNPQGGMVFSNAFGSGLSQVKEWHSFISSGEYCFRACKNGPQAHSYCNNVYDELGCSFNMPAQPVDLGTFESCESDNAQIVGVYTTMGHVSTFNQGQTSTGAPIPDPKPAPRESRCRKFASNMMHGSLDSPFAGATNPAGVKGNAGTGTRTSHSSPSMSQTSSSSYALPTTNSMHSSTTSSSSSTTSSTSSVKASFASVSMEPTSSCSSTKSSPTNHSVVMITSTAMPKSTGASSVMLGGSPPRYSLSKVTILLYLIAAYAVCI